jgi:hypothetical protein
MMKFTTGLASLAVGLAFVSGCGPNDANGISEQDIAEQWLSKAMDNSAQANGVQLNGIRYNGIRYNGIRYNGIRYNGIRYNGIRYNGTSLSGTREDQSVEVDSTALTGTDIEGSLSDGGTLAIKVVSIQWNSIAGVYLYTLKHYNEDSAQWEWLCGLDGNSVPIAAMPIMKAYLHPTYDLDTEDQSRFTFGCVNAAVAKCALWGHAPWDTAYARDLQLDHQVPKPRHRRTRLSAPGPCRLLRQWHVSHPQRHADRCLRRLRHS